jgi:PilZ domain
VPLFGRWVRASVPCLCGVRRSTGATEMQQNEQRTTWAGQLERPVRRSLRRALAIECNIECETWDGMVSLPVTDLSNEGLWVESEVSLSPGEELVVSFQLPDTPHAPRIWATARVARVGLWRRRDDVHASGMGLVFTYCSEADRRRLSAFLVGRPPPLPPACVRSVARELEANLMLLPPSVELALPPVLDIELAEA